MLNKLRLPQANRTLIDYTPGPAPSHPLPNGPLRARVAYAAVHVVADPLADTTPIAPPQLDWEATMAYRRYLWSLGFAVAEAMDTAQRGMGLDWPTAQELIRRSLGRGARGWRSNSLRRGHRSPTAARRPGPGRCRRSLRRAGRLCRGCRWARDPDGQPRAGGRGTWAGRLRAGV